MDVTNGTTSSNQRDEPAVGGGTAGVLEGSLDRAVDQVRAAIAELAYSNKQEAQAARQRCEEALVQLEVARRHAESLAVGEGQPRG